MRIAKNYPGVRPSLGLETWQVGDLRCHCCPAGRLQGDARPSWSLWWAAAAAAAGSHFPPPAAGSLCQLLQVCR